VNDLGSHRIRRPRVTIDGCEVRSVMI
jgi:hypothetical protein